MKTTLTNRQNMRHQRGGAIHGRKRKPGTKKKALRAYSAALRTGLAKAKAAVRERVSELA